DHGHQHVAGAHPLFDGLDEVDARLNAIDVHEDFILGKAAVEVVVQPSGRVGGVLTPVTDEDLAVHVCNPGSVMWLSWGWSHEARRRWAPPAAAEGNAPVRNPVWARPICRSI